MGLDAERRADGEHLQQEREPGPAGLAASAARGRRWGQRRSRRRACRSGPLGETGRCDRVACRSTARPAGRRSAATPDEVDETVDRAPGVGLHGVVEQEHGLGEPTTRRTAERPITRRRWPAGSRAWRRAGPGGSTRCTPTSEPGDDDDQRASCGDTENVGDALILAGGLHDGPAEEDPDARCRRRCRTRRRGSPPSGSSRAIWRRVSPDGPEQAELSGALVDRQRQRVGDADDGDDDGQDEHHVDDAQRPG